MILQTRLRCARVSSARSITFQALLAARLNPADSNDIPVSLSFVLASGRARAWMLGGPEHVVASRGVEVWCLTLIYVVKGARNSDGTIWLQWICSHEA